ncbi:hypothetical protein E2C01_048675 [Portunus trituberculatus]|uniref:Uncharacterized protein n=1 Tax=Portunus trituberculatus TaxID=210409 RepID=A0A5B7G3Q2_PORTR|nr:hypothetical protein [Portunus trituberculatus]
MYLSTCSYCASLTQHHQRSSTFPRFTFLLLNLSPFHFTVFKRSAPVAPSQPFTPLAPHPLSPSVLSSTPPSLSRCTLFLAGDTRQRHDLWLARHRGVAATKDERLCFLVILARKTDGRGGEMEVWRCGGAEGECSLSKRGRGGYKGGADN